MVLENLNPQIVEGLIQQYGPVLLFMAGAYFIAKWVASVGPRRARMLESIRGRIWSLLGPLTGPVGRRIPPVGEPRKLTRDVSDTNDYIGYTNDSQRQVEKALHKNGWNWNPISTKKYRGDGEYTIGTWVYRSSLFSSTQLHCYLFENEDGQVEVYCHKEPSVITKPSEHASSGARVSGDPDGRLRADLKDGGIDLIE
jgi:hypothetical protein